MTSCCTYRKKFQAEANLPRVNREHPHVDSWKVSTTRHLNLPETQYMTL